MWHELVSLQHVNPSILCVFEELLLSAIGVIYGMIETLEMSRKQDEQVNETQISPVP